MLINVDESGCQQQSALAAIGSPGLRSVSSVGHEVSRSAFGFHSQRFSSPVGDEPVSRITGHLAYLCSTFRFVRYPRVIRQRLKRHISLVR
jgi:hypothetical protein